MSEATVREALATAAATVSGLRASGYMPAVIKPPHAVVVPGEFDPRMVLAESKTERVYEVVLFTAKNAPEASQKLLDTYCELSGSTSVIAAIQTATALNNGATADYAEVVAVSGLEVTPNEGVEYLTRKLTVEVVF